MAFAGLNWVAILVAAVAAWLFGAVYYMALSKPWLAAQGLTLDELARRRAASNAVTMALPFILSFVAEIVMAWMMAGVLGHLGPGQVTLRNGVISGAFLWFGFILTALTVNYAYAARAWLYTALDVLHWLGVMLIIGAVVGWFGAR